MTEPHTIRLDDGGEVTIRAIEALFGRIAALEAENARLRDLLTITEKVVHLFRGSGVTAALAVRRPDIGAAIRAYHTAKDAMKEGDHE